MQQKYREETQPQRKKNHIEKRFSDIKCQDIMSDITTTQQAPIEPKHTNTILPLNGMINYQDISPPATRSPYSPSMKQPKHFTPKTNNTQIHTLYTHYSPLLARILTNQTDIYRNQNQQPKNELGVHTKAHKGAKKNPRQSPQNQTKQEQTTQMPTEAFVSFS